VGSDQIVRLNAVPGDIYEMNITLNGTSATLSYNTSNMLLSGCTTFSGSNIGNGWMYGIPASGTASAVVHFRIFLQATKGTVAVTFPTSWTLPTSATLTYSASLIASGISSSKFLTQSVVYAPHPMTIFGTESWSTAGAAPDRHVEEKRRVAMIRSLDTRCVRSKGDVGIDINPPYDPQPPPPDPEGIMTYPVLEDTDLAECLESIPVEELKAVLLRRTATPNMK